MSDTTYGGQRRDFPSTQWGLIAKAKDFGTLECQEALGQLCRLYWKPVYVCIRAHRGYGEEEAKDLTQEFFADVLGGVLERFSPEKGTFRSYLRGALRHFLAKDFEKSRAGKRGGGKRILHLGDIDPSQIQGIRSSPDSTPERVFEEQWARSVLEHAFTDLKEELRRKGKDHYFPVFEEHEIQPPAEGRLAYASLAQDLGVTDKQIENILRYCRKLLRRLILRRVRDYSSEESVVGTEIADIFSAVMKRE